MEICYLVKSFAGVTCGFSYREDQVIPLHDCLKDISSHLRSCKFSDPENEVDLVLSRAGIFETPKDIDDFTNYPTHRANLGVGWNRGSNSRWRVPKEMSGRGKGRVNSIPKADRGIGKRLSQIVQICFSSPKSHQNLSLLNVKCAARISTPREPLYIRGRGCAPGISKTTARKS